jgi:hypothetical protein
MRIVDLAEAFQHLRTSGAISFMVSGPQVRLRKVIHRPHVVGKQFHSLAKSGNGSRKVTASAEDPAQLVISRVIRAKLNGLMASS